MSCVQAGIAFTCCKPMGLLCCVQPLVAWVFFCLALGGFSCLALSGSSLKFSHWWLRFCLLCPGGMLDGSCLLFSPCGSCLLFGCPSRSHCAMIAALGLSSSCKLLQQWAVQGQRAHRPGKKAIQPTGQLPGHGL